MRTRPRPAARRRRSMAFVATGDRRPWVWAGISERGRSHSCGSPQRNGGRSRPSPRGEGPETVPNTSRLCKPSGGAGVQASQGVGMVPTWPSRSSLATCHETRATLGREAGFSKEVLRKEVIQPQVPLRLPCYDLVPITGFIFGACLSAPTTSDAPRFGGLTGGVYKAQEHIHRRSADRRLLAIPASCGRVAARNPNWGAVFAISAALRPGDALSAPL